MLSCVANKNVWGKLSLLIVSIPIALLVNVIRVITISIFILHDMRWIIEERWHSLFGILLFIISLHMLLLSERAIECLTRIK
jgi:exosortase/archaeosortase family protein